MRKILCLITIAVMISLSTLPGPNVAHADTEPNTPEEITELNRIFFNLFFIVGVIKPSVIEMSKHYAEVHHAGFNLLNFETLFRQYYPRTSRYVDSAIARNATSRSMRFNSAPLSGMESLGPAGVVLGSVVYAASIAQARDENLEAEIRRDLEAMNFGTPEEIEREANFQSTMIEFHDDLWKRFLIPLYGPGQAWQWLQEYFEESDDSRYNLEEYIYELQGHGSPWQRRNRNRRKGGSGRDIPSVGGGDMFSYFFGTGGPRFQDSARNGGSVWSPDPDYPQLWDVITVITIVGNPGS